MWTIARAAVELAAGMSSQSLVEECLARILDPAGEGPRAFLKVHTEAARAASGCADDLRRHRGAPRFAGIPVSVKDLFDMAGDVTTAGSVALADAAPAVTDAAAVARVRAAGFIPVGRTNMTEFAYSGIGLNPHFGTPRNPWDRATGRIPGGSSSGAAVSVSDGMAVAALGTDTGGSCRAPAALCGVVGFKPTAQRIPSDGVVPLSFTLDSIGSLAPSVACCATLDAVMAGEEVHDLQAFPLDGLRLAAPQTLVLDSLEAPVAEAYGDALGRLAKAGVRIVDVALTELAEVAALNRQGGIAASEAYAWHRELIAAEGARYDPRVLRRIMAGRDQDAAYYIDLVRTRAGVISSVSAVSARFDAMIMPTCPVVAAPIAAVAVDEDFFAVNARVLRNTTLFNLLDRCAISIPCHRPGGAPVGLMLVGEHGGDRRLLAIAAAVEAAVSPHAA